MMHPPYSPMLLSEPNTPSQTSSRGCIINTSPTTRSSQNGSRANLDVSNDSDDEVFLLKHKLQIYHICYEIYNIGYKM